MSDQDTKRQEAQERHKAAEEKRRLNTEKKFVEAFDTLIKNIKSSAEIDIEHYQRFFKIINTINLQITSLTKDQKNRLSRKTSQAKGALLYGKGEIGKTLFKQSKDLYIFQRANTFLRVYINDIYNKDDLKITHFKELYQIFTRDYFANNVHFRDHKESLRHYYDVANSTLGYSDGDNADNRKKIHDDAVHKIKKIFEHEACKYYILARQRNSYYPEKNISPNQLLDKNFIKEKELFSDINRILHIPTNRPHSTFHYSYRNFIHIAHGLVWSYYEDQGFYFYNFENLYKSYITLLLENPFCTVNNAFMDFLNNFETYMEEQELFADQNQQAILPTNYGLEEHDLEGNAANLINEAYNVNINENYFEKSALEIEKPSIPPTPGHPQEGKPEITPSPASPSQGKPEITAQGEKPESSLKEQTKGKSNQQEEIKDIVALPPTELPKEKPLTDALLSYSFLSSLKGGRAFVARQFPLVDRLVQRFMPQLSYVSNLSSNLLQKATVNPSTKTMRGAPAQKTATFQSSGNSKTATGKKAGMSVKGHFVTYAVFIGLETLHAKLINSGYKRAASFVPVTSNWRPWGNAFFANFDRNLQINPESGYSTTRLFNHVADGVAYLAEGVSNSINYVGNREASFYSNLLAKEVTGFDARFFGLINGATEVGYRVVDTLGGSLDKRRAKALDKFYTNHPNEKETMEEKTSRLKNSIFKKRQSKSWVELNKIGLKTTKPSTTKISKTSSKMKDIDVKDLETSKTKPTKAKPSQLTYKASLYNKEPNMMGKVDAKVNLFDRKSQKTWTTSNSLFTKTKIKLRSAKPGNGRLGVIPQD